MAELNDWNVTAANNNSAPPNGWPENTMQYSEVNDTGREGMAVMKRYFADMNGSLTTTGAANAYLVTLNAGYVAYFTGMTFTVKIHADNTGASTINVNSIGVKSIVNGDGGAINAGQLKNGGLYRFSYDGTNFQLIGQGAYGALAQQDTINDSDWSGTDLAIANGGTGASTATAARTNLGLGSIATQNSTSVTITGGSISGVTLSGAAISGGTVTGISDLAVADGGTGASDAGTARTNLGVAIGSNVQAWDVNLDQIAALAVTNGNFIVGNGSAWVAESGATARASLGLGSLATLSSINGSNWSGTDLAVVDGGTGASTASAARTNLGAIGTGDSPTFGAVTATTYNVSTADTTLSRSRAGEIDCENKPVIMHQSTSMTGGLIRVQSGGSPSGGNNGDIWFIY